MLSTARPLPLARQRAVRRGKFRSPLLLVAEALALAEGVVVPAEEGGAEAAAAVGAPDEDVALGRLLLGWCSVM